MPENYFTFFLKHTYPCACVHVYHEVNPQTLYAKQRESKAHLFYYVIFLIATWILNILQESSEVCSSANI